MGLGLLGSAFVLATIGWYFSTDPHNPNATIRENKGWAVILLSVALAFAGGKL